MDAGDHSNAAPSESRRNGHPGDGERRTELGSWYTDFEPDETRWSQVAREMFGVAADDDTFEHDDVVTAVTPRHRDVVERKRRALFAGEPFDIEYQIEVDGSPRWIRERAEIRRNEAGNPVEAFGVLEDVTDQREHERDLELFRTLVDNATDGIFVIDSYTSAILDVNETACHMLGYDKNELVGMSVPDFNPAFSVERWTEFAASVRENGTRKIESEHRREDGTTFPVEIRISHVSLDQEYHVATVRDITERRERERELAASRKRYRTFIEAAPDPIFVADADTGELVEANAAAAELRNQPRQEIVGLHQSALHPNDDADRYRQLFENHIDYPNTITEFEDGTPLYLTTVDGERIPVAISTSTVTLDERTLIHGIFRDISERRRYETALAGINTAARELLEAETDAEIAQIVVDSTATVLDASGSGICLSDEHSGELVPTAYSERLSEILDDVPSFSPGEGIAWRVFTEQEQAHFDDVRTTDDVYNAGTPIRSEILVPLGEHGVFLVGDTSVGAFDATDEEIAETLASTAVAALNRADRTQRLRERERESKVQAERLERVNQLNEEIRTIMQALIQAQSVNAVTQQVCESLASLDRFTYAWIGRPDPARTEMRVSADAGAQHHYLDAISRDCGDGNSLPSVRAAREQTTVTEPRIAAEPHTGEWRDAALKHGFQSVISVPLVYRDFLYGVMTVYSDRAGAFDERTSEVLTKLGELLAYALNKSEQQNALLGDRRVDLTFTLTDATDIVVELADRLSTELHVQNIIARSEQRYLLHFVAEDVETDDVQAVADELTSIAELRMIDETDQLLYEAVVVGDCLVTTLATVGANVHSVVVSSSQVRVQATLPEGREKQTLVRRLTDRYPELDVAIQRSIESPQATWWMQLLETALTDRQLDILKTAYYSGYFDKKRKRTGGDIADSLGISQPAFSTQIRAAQLNLLSEVFADGSGGDVTADGQNR